MDAVHLSCPLCGEPPPDGAMTLPSWARIGAFASASWPAEPAASDEESAPGMDGPPRVGTRRTLAVRHPFRAVAGQPFWVMFQPEGVAERGWSERPDLLEGLCVVECSLLEVKALALESAVLLVEVLDVLPLWEAASRFAADPSGRLPDLPMQTSERLEWRDLTWLAGSFEGDVGGWVLCQMRGAERILLAQDEWSFHFDYVYVGHRPLTTREWRKLERAFGSADGGG